MPFYLGRPTIMVQEPDELAFDVEQESTKWVSTINAFVSHQKVGGQAIAMMGPGTYDQFAAQGVPMIVIGRDARRVIARHNQVLPPWILERGTRAELS